jgi:hypothetical protein
MTLDEAVAEFEAGMVVSDAVGFLVEGEPARLDKDKTPDGKSYVTLTSGGIITDGDRIPIWAADEERGAGEWLRQAWRYAEHRGLGLWWRDRPVWLPAEFVATHQAGLLQDVRTRSSLAIQVGFVWSRLYISE